MSDAGQPKPWTFSRVLGLMDEKGRTGILECSSGEGTTRVHLRQGYVVNVEEVSGAEGWVLGDSLLQSGTVSADDLLSARRLAQKQGLTLEEALVRRGLLSEDILKRFVDLQIADLLFPLFRRKGLNINFIEERPLPAPYGTALPVSYVLREAEKRSEQWTALRQRVGAPQAVYRKDSALLPELLGYEEPVDDEPLPELGANAKVVYFFVNGEKTVEQVARAAGLTLFDTYRAMGELLDAYLLHLVTHHGEGERDARGQSGLPRVVGVLTWLLLAGLLALGGQWLLGGSPQLRSFAGTTSPRIAAVMAEADAQLVERALQLYYLARGEFPERLDELQDAGWLGPEVSRTALPHLAYRRVADAYWLTYAP